MTDTENLKEEQLKQASGGMEPPVGVNPKYKQGDVVENNDNWILEIRKFIGWANDNYGYIYDSIIIELPDHYKGSYYVGEHYTVPEKRIIGKRFGN